MEYYSVSLSKLDLTISEYGLWDCWTVIWWTILVNVDCESWQLALVQGRWTCYCANRLRDRLPSSELMISNDEYQHWDENCEITYYHCGLRVLGCRRTTPWFMLVTLFVLISGLRHLPGVGVADSQLDPWTGTFFSCVFCFVITVSFTCKFCKYMYIVLKSHSCW